MSDPHRQLFLRYREHGDVAALGALFDEIAVELFRLALFLAPDASDAEDLVQGTFLTAIESAQAYDDSRPLRPWLMGILTNLAHRRRRDRSRDRPSQIPDGLEACVDMDTTGAAERAEIRNCFAEAMRGLPQPYRQVLTLHLEEGLTARRIGEVLERPAGTVRSQVVRGLVLLRKAMPASVVGGLAVAVTTGHALAGVRIEVLRRATDWTPSISATGSTFVGGSLRTVPRHLVTVTAAAVLLAGFAWAWWRAPGATLPPPVSAVVAATAAGVVAPGPGLLPVVPSGDAGQQRTRATATAPPVALRVRLVDREGVAQAGLTCRVVATGGANELFAVKCLRDDSANLKSDGDGWIAFEGRGNGAYDAWIVGTNMRRRFTLPDAAAATGISWEIPNARIVSGRVRAADGTPLAGIDVFASASAGSMDVAVPVARSSQDGSFAFLVPAARTFVWAAGNDFCSGAVLTSDAEVDLVSDSATGTVHIAIEDPGGEPAAGCVMAGFAVAPAGTLRPVLFALADDRGVTRLAGLPVGGLVVAASNGDANSERHSLDVHAGATTSVTLRLEPGASVEGRVVDAAGSPMRGRAVYAQAPQLRADSFDGRLFDRMALTDDDGRFMLTGLPRGDVRLRITPLDKPRELAYERVVLAAGERRLLDWQIGEQKLRGRVTGVADPAGCSVTVAPIDPSGQILPVHRFVEPVAADGTFAVPVPPRFRAFAVHIARAGSPAPLVFHHAQALVRDHTKPIELVVGPSAAGCTTVSATLIDHRDRHARVALVRGSMHATAKVCDRGRVSFSGVTGGDYSLRVERADGFAWTRRIEVLADRPAVDLGNLSPRAEGMLVVEAAGELTLMLRDARGCAVRDVPQAMPIALETGSYELLVRGADAVPQVVPITIAAGDETRCRLAARAGARCCFEFTFDPLDNTTDIRAELGVAVFDAQGGLAVADRVARPIDCAYRWTQTLAAGVYRVEAVAAFGGAASCLITVDGDEPASWSRQLRLP